MITSPCLSPASDAGPEATTVVTRTPAGSVEFATPTPRNAGDALVEPLPPLPFPFPFPPLPLPFPPFRSVAVATERVGDAVAVAAERVAVPPKGSRVRDPHPAVAVTVVADGVTDEEATAEDHERGDDGEGPPRAPSRPRRRVRGRRAAAVDRRGGDRRRRPAPRSVGAAVVGASPSGGSAWPAVGLGRPSARPAARAARAGSARSGSPAPPAGVSVMVSLAAPGWDPSRMPARPARSGDRALRRI